MAKDRARSIADDDQRALALIGSMIAMLLTGGVFSVATLVGFSRSSKNCRSR